MAEPPPPRDPPDPADDETVVVPPSEPVPVPVDETIVRDEWGAETVVEQPAVEEEVVVEETEAQRKPPTIWPWLLGFLLLVLAGLGAYFYFAQQDESTVPAVTGLQQARAETEVRDAGLEPVATPQESDRPAGIVLAQSPDAGDKVDEGSNVRLVVSAGREPVAVPDVVGTTSSEATATLREVGLEVNVVAVPSGEPSGSVVAQSPSAGEQADVGSTVRLNVAREPDETTTQPAGTTPVAPAPQPATTTEAPAPEPATVPDVVGQELADAAGAFADEGLKVGVRYVPSTEPQGRVVAQAQPAGTELQRGDTVQVNVSIGPDPAASASVPNVTGRRLDEARQALEQAGFEVLALDPSGGGKVQNSSSIASQSPAAGAGIPRGALVLVYV